MEVANKKHVEEWLSKQWDRGFVFLRFHNYQVTSLDMTWKQELEKHAEIYKQSPRHYTFHHIRSLMKDLQDNEIRHPLVGVILDGQIQINPGGSRLMVAKHLGKKTVPLDLIMHKSHVDEFAIGDHSEVRNVAQMFDPFADCDFTCRVDLHDEYYEIDMPQFHWAHDDIGKWLEEKGGIVCENLLDYYQL